eukprot:COSAG04_NODE_6458_length_1322_cov_1.807850_1_plen_120_part_01
MPTPSVDLGRLRGRQPPAHRAAGAPYPPADLCDVYARGQYGLDAIRDPPVHAAVLVPLVIDSAGELLVLLTLRTRRLKRHSGEVALPGGKRDASDDGDVGTALREAREEIGLQPDVLAPP